MTGRPLAREEHGDAHDHKRESFSKSECIPSECLSVCSRTTSCRRNQTPETLTAVPKSRLEKKGKENSVSIWDRVESM